MSYFFEMFDSFLMSDFAKAYREYQLKDDIEGWEMLFRNFFDAKDNSSLLSRNWAFFQKTCRELVGLGYYSPILTFMYGVYYYGNKYNIEMITSNLLKVTLPDGNNLAQLCEDFYLYVQRRSKEDYKYSDFGDNGSSRSYSPFLITIYLPEYIAKNIYGIDIDSENIGRADIDSIVRKAIEIKVKEYEKQNEYYKKINDNAIKLEEESNGDLRIGRQPLIEITEFNSRKMVPGALLDFFIAAEATDQIDICYYILGNYVWPIFSLIPWEQKHKAEIRLMGVLLSDYADSIISLEVAHRRNLLVYAIEPPYTENEFYEELIGHIDGGLLKPGKELYSDYPEMGLAMANAITMGKEVIKDILPDYLYSFLMAFTPYVLYCCGNNEEAADFLIRNFSEIGNYDKRRLYVQLTLVRTILSTSRLEKASTLYGYFNIEMDRQAREKETVINYFKQIIQYITDVREYLKFSNTATRKTKKLWVDVIFGDGRIMLDQAIAKAAIENEDVPSREVFDSLLKYIEAFSHEPDISLRILGLNDTDLSEESPTVLSYDLRMQGQGYVNKAEEVLAYYQSLEHEDIRKNVNIFLQQHISGLMDASINDSIAAFKELRKRFAVDAPEEAELVSGQMLSAIDSVIKELSRKLQSQYTGRDEVEMEIAKLQKDFVAQFSLPVPNGSLISLLPIELRQDCLNFIVTSEIVFRMLSKREDRDKLDFSPALISLTKVLELILNYVFKKMDADPSIGVGKDKGYYFNDDGTKKESIEFGACIYLLCDGGINVNNINGSISLSWYNNYIARGSRFDEWGGNRVLDIERLKSFDRIKLKIDKKKNKKVIKTFIASFSRNDSEYNRMLLAKGLEYIKDNYRNFVAHKDGVSMQSVQECREILLQSRFLLWVLMYLLK